MTIPYANPHQSPIFSCPGAQKLRPCTDFSKPYIFASYSHKDTADVCQILQMMQQNHFCFWYDEGIDSGTQWDDVLYERIVNCTQFVCFLTKESVQSIHVKNEIHIAVKYGKPILPVFLDDVELRGGLELMLDRQQSLTRGDYSAEDFYQKLCGALDRHTVDHIATNDNSALKELQKNYHLEAQIGGGFSGKVYLGTGMRTNCKVIVKHATLDSSYTGKSIRNSYENECAVLSQQISCYAPIAIDYLSDESNIYLVESYVQGTALSKTENLTDHEITGIFIKAAKILKRYHDIGIVHCDIKPEHILIHDGEVFLIDFGACHFMDRPANHHSIGSIYYAAPEQFGKITHDGQNTGPAIDGRTDMYALGRSLLFALARNHGTLQTIDTDKTTILDRQISFYTKQRTYALDQERYCNEVNPLLRAVVDKMIALEPSARFKNMDEVITCLSAL